MAKQFKRKRFFHLTAHDEPNIGVVAIEIATADNMTLIDPEKANNALRAAIEEHFDATVIQLDPILFTDWELKTTISATITGDGDDSILIELHETWIYGL